LTGNYKVYVGLDNTGVTHSLNAGQRAFAYTAPSGFKALVDTNLPAPAVAKSNTVMDVKLYTGNGSTQTISGLNFSPDLVWIKQRSGGGSSSFHGLWDQVRGTGKYLGSNTTAAESGNTGDLLGAFNSDGFSVNRTYLGGTNGTTNENAESYVSWNWDAGTSTVTNNNGNVTSQVRANPSAGFSISTFTPITTPTDTTVGHGLNVAPQLIIVKDRPTAAYQWCVWHSGIAANQYLLLNSTNAVATSSAVFSTLPTSSVFTLGNGFAGGPAFVAYCFAPVSGYSAMGSYVGNGSTNGPFVYTGFKSRWILIKSTTSARDWLLWDTARDPYNVSTAGKLSPNLSDAEYYGGGAYATPDVCSNGFKMRVATTNINASGETHIWIAFAENPFQYARAR
jgi:hypothetical protein